MFKRNMYTRSSDHIETSRHSHIPAICHIKAKSLYYRRSKKASGDEL